MFKTLFFILAFSVFSSTFAADPGTTFGVERITENLQNGGDDLVLTADNIFGYIIGLFYFIAMLFAIYGGFTILTSGGDEDKVKKGKNLIIYVVIGLALVFLASQIVTWIIGIMSDEDIVGPTTALFQYIL